MKYEGSTSAQHLLKMIWAAMQDGWMANEVSCPSQAAAQDPARAAQNGNGSSSGAVAKVAAVLEEPVSAAFEPVLGSQVVSERHTDPSAWSAVLAGLSTAAASNEAPARSPPPAGEKHCCWFSALVFPFFLVLPVRGKPAGSTPAACMASTGHLSLQVSV